MKRKDRREQRLSAQKAIYFLKEPSGSILICEPEQAATLPAS
jgi:hypothetical protein